MTLTTILGDADRFAVVDVETTGLYRHDRIVEIAIVTMDAAGHVIDEWESLVDPARDVGPTHIHGIAASMVSAAPRFEELASAIAERTYGAVLVAHNLAFDRRMLVQDFERAGARFLPGDGVCTLRLGGGKLGELCRECGVQHEHAHRALSDARATAELLLKLGDRHSGECSCARIVGVDGPYQVRTLRREAVGAASIEVRPLARLSTRAHHYGRQGAELAYLDMLDRAVADLVVTAEEREELDELASSLGLTQFDVRRLHRAYVDDLAAAAVRDGVVSRVERDLLRSVSQALGEDSGLVDEMVDSLREQSESADVQPGWSVCFTGTAIASDGSKIPRSRLEHIATTRGLTPTKSVTREGCDLLVASDPTSQSGKAKKARQYGVPVMSVDEFLGIVRLMPEVS